MKSAAALAAAIACGCASAATVQTVDSLNPKSFGTGRSQVRVTNKVEFELYNRTLDPTVATHGVITHWWITGQGTGGNNPNQETVADYAIWRFYVDGEATVSTSTCARYQHNWLDYFHQM